MTTVMVTVMLAIIMAIPTQAAIIGRNRCTCSLVTRRREFMCSRVMVIAARLVITNSAVMRLHHGTHRRVISAITMTVGRKIDSIKAEASKAAILKRKAIIIRVTSEASISRGAGSMITALGSNQAKRETMTNVVNSEAEPLTAKLKSA